MKSRGIFLKKAIVTAFVLSILLSVGITQVFAAKDTTSDSKTEVHGSIAPVSEEYLEYLKSGKSQNGSIPSSVDLSYLGERYEESMARTRARLPESYDMRDYGLVGPVRDQGEYGTCWAFGTLGSAESALMQKQFSLIEFSKKHLAWFALTGNDAKEFIKFNYDMEAYDPYLIGGNNLYTLSTLAAWSGPIYSSKLPYDSFDTDPDESLRYDADFHLQDCVYTYTTIFPTRLPEASSPDTKLVKQLIMENGAYEISYLSEGYESEYYSEDTFAMYHDKTENPNHSNLIVGWDDNFSKENFQSGCQPQNDGAWLVCNSWGTSWGDDGYFWLSYEDKTIEMEGSAYTFEDKDNYEKNYQYDMTGWSVSAAADDFSDVSTASKEAYISNIFKAEENEQLEAVSFYTTDVGTEYEISVYTGVKDDNPVSGKLAYSGQQGTEDYCGYHTIELDDAVALKSGTQFSVVVKLTNPEYAYPIATEAVILIDSNIEPEYLGNGGESYYSANGKDWTDIVELGKHAMNVPGSSQYNVYTSNVCMKAFTNPLPEGGEAIGNVDFSLFEGEVALGSELELSGAENIYYTVTPANGTEGSVTKYTDAITIDKPCTVTAWGEKNGKIGNKVSKTFTKQLSRLTDLGLKYSFDDTITHIDLNSNESNIYLENEDEKVSLRPCGKDEITVNGVHVDSNDWSDEILLNAGETNEIIVKTEGEGKDSSTYTINLYRSPLKYNYADETVEFDEENLTVTDKSGNELNSGDSVSPYITISGSEQEYLTVKNKQTDETKDFAVGQRPKLHCVIDYYNERTDWAFKANTYASYNEDMSDAMDISDDYCPIEPGKTVYIKRPASDRGFASITYKLEPPERPEKPKAKIEKIGIDYITLSEVANCEYRISHDGTHGEWQTENSFTDLDPETEYTVEVRLAATDESFASLSDSVSAETLAGAKVKIKYSAFGHIVYEETRIFPEGKSVCYPSESIAEKGYIASESDRQKGKTVTVKNDGDILTPNTDEIVFYVSADVTPSDYTYTVNYWTEDSKILETRTFAFTHTEDLDISEIEIPDGYEQDGLVDDDVDFIAKLTYYKDKWIVQGKGINIKIKKSADDSSGGDGKDNKEDADSDQGQNDNNARGDTDNDTAAGKIDGNTAAATESVKGLSPDTGDDSLIAILILIVTASAVSCIVLLDYNAAKERRNRHGL